MGASTASVVTVFLGGAVWAHSSVTTNEEHNNKPQNKYLTVTMRGYAIILSHIVTNPI